MSCCSVHEQTRFAAYTKLVVVVVVGLNVNVRYDTLKSSVSHSRDDAKPNNNIHKIISKRMTLTSSLLQYGKRRFPFIQYH